MKKILTITLLLIAINAQGQGLPVPANATLASLFPDENLRAVLFRILDREGYVDNNGDLILIGQELSNALATIDMLFADGRNIINADGIEYLVGLRGLVIAGNLLTNLNVSSNINLELLDIEGNNLTNLDLSNNINLWSLWLAGNNLVDLDLSNNINLTRLDIRDNPLISLDLSNNINLEYLWVNGALLDNTLFITKNIIGFRDDIKLNYSPSD